MKKGFTLVELLFVMAIIGIITGIGVTNMSGSTDTAEDTAAQGNVRNVITEAELFYADNITYAGFQTKNKDVTAYVVGSGIGFCLESEGASGKYYRYNSTIDSRITVGTCR